MFTTRPELVGTYGMVATTHWLASSVGMSLLEAGGNAADAAVAAGFTLQVAEPHLNGPAGQLNAVLQVRGAPPVVLCGQGVAPAAATHERFRDLGLDLIPGVGLLPATVPGAWDGWLLLLRDHGTRSLREVLTPALSYARDGVPVTARMSSVIADIAEVFVEEWTESARLWTVGGRAPRPGVLHRNPGLARTWHRLLAEAETVAGREEQIERARTLWAEGFVADAVDAFARTRHWDSMGEPHAGLLSGADMAAWRASFESPVLADFGSWQLAKCGFWTQGPVFHQQLALLSRHLGDVRFEDGLPTPDTIHLIAECGKLAFADREAWYGDGPGVPADLLSPRYADQRAGLVGPTARTDLAPGSPGGATPRLPAAVTRPPASRSGRSGEPLQLPAVTRRGDTVHLNVVDAAGTMVAATSSGGWLQSGPVIPELGFALDTRLQSFWLEQGLANSLVPGRRPRSTLSPTLALRDGVAALAFGTPGGDQQDQWQLNFWLSHTVGGLTLQEAVDAPAFHCSVCPNSFYPRSWDPGLVVLEQDLYGSAGAELRRRGHRPLDGGRWSFGGVSAVARDPGTGILRAAANPRGMQGYAVGR